MIYPLFIQILPNFFHLPDILRRLNFLPPNIHIQKLDFRVEIWFSIPRNNYCIQLYPSDNTRKIQMMSTSISTLEINDSMKHNLKLEDECTSVRDSLIRINEGIVKKNVSSLMLTMNEDTSEDVLKHVLSTIFTHCSSGYCT